MILFVVSMFIMTCKRRVCYHDFFLILSFLMQSFSMILFAVFKSISCNVCGDLMLFGAKVLYDPVCPSLTQ